ncbi:MAG: sigma 54-interacting transcriptional regulator [Firmicutes bacterium]|nr:sigma 54-interacting transcriptional regulator [Bacillota bacterium]
MKELQFDRILNMFNYFDGVIITDERGVIEYYFNSRSDIYSLRMDPIGKNILEVHPYLTEETSSIMRVLKTGKPIYDQIEHLKTEHGQTVTNVYSTFPIVRDGVCVGAIDMSRSVDDKTHQNITRQHIVLPGNTEEKALYQLGDIVTECPQVLELKKRIPLIADTNSAVMIYGETGTGKELIAQSIHTAGKRREKPFISQNCAAIPSTLLESILFGTVKGAYTGAEDRPGLFEMADGGTLFLDEINSMEPAMQAKILRAIEEKQVMRIGGSRTVRFDVKLISALNEEPCVCMEQGKLREDLFYRLSTVLVELPPLRERGTDVFLLSDRFICQNNKVMNKSVLGLSEEVRDIFRMYTWPGNVRELRNVIEGAFANLRSQVIQKDNLPSYMTQSYDEEELRLMAQDTEMSLEEKVAALEKRLILQALDSSPSERTAADRLKISKQSLNYKLKKYDLKTAISRH